MSGEMMFRCTDARLRLAVVWERGGSSNCTSGQAESAGGEGETSAKRAKKVETKFLELRQRRSRDF